MKIYMKRLLVLMLAFSMVIPTMAVAEGDSTSVFKDIEKHWAKSAIEQAVKKGYVSGYPDGTFRPDDPVTVAEFLSMMFRSMTEKDADGTLIWRPELIDPLPDYNKDDFADKPNLDVGKPWYSNVVNEANRLGIINGWDDDWFKSKLTREDSAYLVRGINKFLFEVIVNSYADVAVTQFKDNSKFTSKGGGWNAAAVAIGGIMNGYTDGTWRPDRFVTRAESISIMERLNHVELRTPMKVNLSNVPYSMIPIDGYHDQVFVFANYEMKKIYDQLGKDAVKYSGVGEKHGAGIMYYTDHEMRDTHHYRQNNIDKLNDFSKHYFDMSIGFHGNVYTVTISAEDGRFERASDPLKQFVKLVFAKQADEVIKLISESVSSHRKGNKVIVDKSIERRQVLVHSISGGSNMVDVVISAYADK